MDLIGRKIYINWGDRVIGLEQLLIDPNEMGFKKSEDEGHTWKEGNVKIYDIIEIGGERIEREIGPALDSSGGRSIDQYLTRGSFWITEEEAAKLQGED